LLKKKSACSGKVIFITCTSKQFAFLLFARLRRTNFSNQNFYVTDTRKIFEYWLTTKPDVY
jgi:hypothetical protein